MGTTNRPTSNEPRRMVFLAFPRVCLLDLTGPWEVFAQVNWMAEGTGPYRLELISGDGAAMIQSDAGIAMASHQEAASCDGAIDTLVVPAADPELAMDPCGYPARLIRRLSGKARRIVSICGGAFFLASAGLLDHKNATTHWLASSELAARFPKVNVQENAIFVKDDNVYTSAGVTAGIDLALALVEEDLGRDVALACARQLVMFMRRPGGQSQFSDTLESQHVEEDAIRQLVSWATDNLCADLSVPSMARRAHMSARNFSRVFRKATGHTPASFVEKLRVDAAKRFLEDTEMPLSVVASTCGFGSADSMRRAFHRVVRVAPSDYRKRFCQT